MSIDLQRPVHQGKTYEIVFRNDVESTGVVLVMVGWVPRHGKAVPPPQSMVVAPGTKGSVSGEVPPRSDAHRLGIVASLDKGELGELEIREGDQQHTVETIKETTTWEMVVVP